MWVKRFELAPEQCEKNVHTSPECEAVLDNECKICELEFEMQQKKSKDEKKKKPSKNYDRQNKLVKLHTIIVAKISCEIKPCFCYSNTLKTIKRKEQRPMQRVQYEYVTNRTKNILIKSINY